jgi:hypothetical protein
MSTTRQLITGAMRLLNIYAAGETPSADDMDIAKQALAGMIDSWSNNRLMVYTVTPYQFATVSNQATYTLGVGGNWNTERPMEIASMQARQNPGSAQQLDIPMQSLTDEQYASIAVKNVTSTFPFAYYDAGDYPLRTITLFPIPASGFVIAYLWSPLLDLDNLDVEVSYPPGYERCFRFNLALELAAEFGKTVPEQVGAVALASKQELERLNSTPRYAHGDGGMIRGGRNRFFNYITGNFRTFGNW